MARTPANSKAPRRRAISVTADTYGRAKVWSESTGRSISSLVERLLNDFLHEQGVARVSVPRILHDQPDLTREEIVSQHFTF
jgi:hypothetical protein